MVDEERGLIGLYKALGYSKARILSKYLVYAVSAALIGGIIGDIAGFVAHPLHPLLHLPGHVPAAALQPATSAHSTRRSASSPLWWASAARPSSAAAPTSARPRPPSCAPRPRAPARASSSSTSGPIWRRMGFLNKVTARNLFRYKKRLAMTDLWHHGVHGAPHLRLCHQEHRRVAGAAPVRADLPLRPFGRHHPDDYQTCLERLEDSTEVTSIESIGVDNITVEHDGAKESMQLYVIPARRLHRRLRLAAGARRQADQP